MDMTAIVGSCLLVTVLIGGIVLYNNVSHLDKEITKQRNRTFNQADKNV